MSDQSARVYVGQEVRRLRGKANEDQSPRKRNEPQKKHGCFSLMAHVKGQSAHDAAEVTRLEGRRFVIGVDGGALLELAGATLARLGRDSRGRGLRGSIAGRGTTATGVAATSVAVSGVSVTCGSRRGRRSGCRGRGTTTTGEVRDVGAGEVVLVCAKEVVAEDALVVVVVATREGSEVGLSRSAGAATTHTQLGTSGVEFGHAYLRSEMEGEDLMTDEVVARREVIGKLDRR